jgi:hypothetical protein
MRRETSRVSFLMCPFCVRTLSSVSATHLLLREGRHYSCRASGGGSVVLVDEAAEPVAAPDLADR